MAQEQFIFNQKQMAFLILVNAANDWHPEGFLKELHQEHRQHPTLKSEDFELMMSKLRRLTFEEIQELQWGLHWLVGIAFFEQPSESENAKTEGAIA